MASELKFDVPDVVADENFYWPPIECPTKQVVADVLKALQENASADVHLAYQGILHSDPDYDETNKTVMVGVSLGPQESEPMLEIRFALEPLVDAYLSSYVFRGDSIHQGEIKCIEPLAILFERLATRIREMMAWPTRT
jgi:hypothetical protein